MSAQKRNPKSHEIAGDQHDCRRFIDLLHELQALRERRSEQRAASSQLLAFHRKHLGSAVQPDEFLTGWERKGLEKWDEIHESIRQKGAALASNAIGVDIDPIELNILIATLADPDAEINYGAAAGVVMTLSQRINLSKTSTSDRKITRAETEARALVLICKQPELTAQEIADVVGCHPKTLYKNPRLRKAMRGRKRLGRSVNSSGKFEDRRR